MWKYLLAFKYNEIPYTYIGSNLKYFQKTFKKNKKFNYKSAF